ncbi:MAG TPA: GNAT family N-acetyltransferase [Chitinophagaceae bacterium]|jgi:predicted N-acetyltransferase YhbS|nr:GNAT family N-acetyltransferase [Chitinophagaceae bacterium]
MEISYRTAILPTAEEIIDLYDRAGLPRPTSDKVRIEKMFDNANLLITAWDKEKLVGVSRSITDFSWCCYLADLAIHPDYQKHGIGKKLIWMTKEKAGEQSMVLLLSVPTAMEYYPKAGMERLNNAFIINRDK